MLTVEQRLLDKYQGCALRDVVAFTKLPKGTVSNIWYGYQWGHISLEKMGGLDANPS
jgi:hypothetical protein